MTVRETFKALRIILLIVSASLGFCLLYVLFSGFGEKDFSEALQTLFGEQGKNEKEAVCKDRNYFGQYVKQETNHLITGFGTYATNVGALAWPGRLLPLFDATCAVWPSPGPLVVFFETFKEICIATPLTPGMIVFIIFYLPAKLVVLIVMLLAIIPLCFATFSTLVVSCACLFGLSIGGIVLVIAMAPMCVVMVVFSVLFAVALVALQSLKYFQLDLDTMLCIPNGHQPAIAFGTYVGFFHLLYLSSEFVSAVQAKWSYGSNAGIVDDVLEWLIRHNNSLIKHIGLDGGWKLHHVVDLLYHFLTDILVLYNSSDQTGLGPWGPRWHDAWMLITVLPAAADFFALFFGRVFKDADTFKKILIVKFFIEFFQICLVIIRICEPQLKVEQNTVFALFGSGVSVLAIGNKLRDYPQPLTLKRNRTF